MIRSRRLRRSPGHRGRRGANRLRSTRSGAHDDHVTSARGPGRARFGAGFAAREDTRCHLVIDEIGDLKLDGRFVEHRRRLPGVPAHPGSVRDRGAGLSGSLRLLRRQRGLRREQYLRVPIAPVRRGLYPVLREPLVQRRRDRRRLSGRLQRVVRVPAGPLPRIERMRLREVDLRRREPVVPEPQPRLARLRLPHLLITLGPAQCGPQLAFRRRGLRTSEGDQTRCEQ